MKVIIIRGPLGVGKSTVGKIIAEKLGGQYVSIDQVLEEHGLDRAIEGEGIPVDNFLQANKIVIEQIASSFELKAIVIDGNFYHKEQVENLVSLLGDDVHVFTLKASVDTCIQRDAARTKSYGEDAARVVHMFVSAFDYGEILDTEDRSIEETASMILASLKA